MYAEMKLPTHSAISACLMNLLKHYKRWGPVLDTIFVPIAKQGSNHRNLSVNPLTRLSRTNVVWLLIIWRHIGTLSLVMDVAYTSFFAFGGCLTLASPSF